MTTKKAVLKKPDTTQRFSGARNFATGGDAPQAAQVDTPAPAKNTVSQEKAPPLKRIKNDAPTVRENFDLEEDLSNQMRFFLANSRKFRSKRAFLTQCLIDGLKKYDGQ